VTDHPGKVVCIRQYALALSVVLCLAGQVFASAPAKNAESLVVPAAVVRQRSSDPLSASTLEFLNSQDSSQARVWVFFVDKGFEDHAGFVSAAADVTLTDRAVRRRSKIGREGVLFADLPVSQTYIESVVSLGGSLRRTSRWLNAASFDIPTERLADVASLPTVVEILPVARFQRSEEAINIVRTMGLPEALSPESPDYGPSQYQLNMIRIAVAHGMGLSGEGVTLTMTDTGFRKTHDALKESVAEGRVLAEYDFVDNDSITSMEEGDSPTQWDHGTLVWSVAGGHAPGRLYGPAFGANFILCKTEDITSETRVEEDNWVAALEFADSIGTDVISTSLSYSAWYQYSDMDGQTAVISRAAGTCDALGIVLVVAAGNRGSTPGSVRAPADAFDILAVGAVDRSRLLAGFSSRGPTYDGRIKPEVCAMGVDTYGAATDDDSHYLYADGTSLAAPLVAGAACLMLEGRPDLTPAEVRQALQATAHRSSQPDNDWGWGIIDVGKALLWPLDFAVSSRAGQVPLEVAFTNNSYLDASSLLWDFGDGTTSIELNPTHTYDTTGVYDVTLSIDTEAGSFTRTLPGMISAHSDTLEVPHVEALSFTGVRVDIRAHNFLPLNQIVIPFTWAGELLISYDSFSTAGLRTENISNQQLMSFSSSMRQATIALSTPTSGDEPPLPPGEGPVVSLYFTVPIFPWSAFNPVRLISYGGYSPSFRATAYDYTPELKDGSIRLGCCLGRVGDVDGVGGDEPSLADVMALVDFIYISGSAPDCLTEADVNQSGGYNAGRTDITLGDIMMLVTYLFIPESSVQLPDCP
jgi:subtilisin family serine protease